MPVLKSLCKLFAGDCKLYRYTVIQIYGFSVCVMKFQNELSSSFIMERGVRHCAASSVILFNVFIDGLFNHLESECSLEKILNDLHALIHADDTIIVSTDRQKCIYKCNETIKFISKHKLNLNIGKSCYLIINCNDSIHAKKNLILELGVLKYKQSLANI